MSLLSFLNFPELRAFISLIFHLLSFLRLESLRRNPQYSSKHLDSQLFRMSGCNQYLNFEGTKNLWFFLSRWRDVNMHMKTIRSGSNDCALQLYPAAKVMKINFDVETLKRASVCRDSPIKLLSILFGVCPNRGCEKEQSNLPQSEHLSESK